MFNRKRRKFNSNCRTNNMNGCFRGTDTHPTLSYSDSGPYVFRIQNMLTKLLEVNKELPVILVDGYYGEETKRAVSKFQESMGINNTGIVDEVTWKELEKNYNFLSNNSRVDVNVNMNTKEGFHNKEYDAKIVGLGSKGENVTELQVYLNKISDKYPAIEKLDVDGIFGPKTEEAVKTFQGLFNLPTDGIVGKYTWTALYDANAGKIEAKPSDLEE